MQSRLNQVLEFRGASNQNLFTYYTETWCSNFRVDKWSEIFLIIKTDNNEKYLYTFDFSNMFVTKQILISQ